MQLLVHLLLFADENTDSATVHNRSDGSLSSGTLNPVGDGSAPPNINSGSGLPMNMPLQSMSLHTSAAGHSSSSTSSGTHLSSQQSQNFSPQQYSQRGFLGRGRVLLPLPTPASIPNVGFGRGGGPWYGYRGGTRGRGGQGSRGGFSHGRGGHGRGGRGRGGCGGRGRGWRGRGRGRGEGRISPYPSSIVSYVILYE